VLLTGRHLMLSGELETDLAVLGTAFPYVPELIEIKRTVEKGPFPAALEARLRADAAALRVSLEEARDSSPLPEHPTEDAVEALHQLLVDARLGYRPSA
jgi:uncharacterized protein